MAPDQQVALTRASRNTSSHLPKAARSVIPAFLQKLYEMVNDDRNSHLIRWSDTGDSFYVLDHERFAREVLGRWFKHQNFASFVRQLNMYGFHKIPHLQQGVLRNDSDTEFWNFEHPNFIRGQGDLLYLIQRKKQAPSGEDTSAADNGPKDIEQTPAMPTNLTPGQILDINSIVNGIAAIKRHQTAISAELSELKTSNEHLWQEALAARERHKMQQDTINRILKFLAGVFGNAGGPVQMRKDGGGNNSSRAVVPRMGQRLMIEGTRIPSKGVQDNMGKDLFGIEPDSLFPKVQSSDLHSASIEARPPHPPSIASPAVVDVQTPSTHAPDVEMNPAPPSGHLGVSDPSMLNPGVTTLTAPSSPPPEAVLQAMLNQAMSNPSQLQRLLTALGSHQPVYPLPDAQSPAPASQLTTFDPQMDFARQFSVVPNSENTAASPLSASVTLLPLDSQDALSHLDPLVTSADRLHQSYKDTAEINKDVDALSSSISSLIESLGVDPNFLNFTDVPQATPPEAMDATGITHEGHTPLAQDYDFESFWSQLTPPGDPSAVGSPAFVNLPAVQSPFSGPELEAASEHFQFLNDLASQQSNLISSSAVPLDQVHLNSTSSRRKRKSETAELDEHTTGAEKSIESGEMVKRKK